MVSDRAAAANRRNAQASTGPRTAVGRRHSSQNARKHGLSSRGPDPDAEAAVSRLAALIVAELGLGPDRADAARDLAEAQHDLGRVRAHKTCLIADVLARRRATDSSEAAVRAIEELMVALDRLERYERRAFSRRNGAARRVDPSFGFGQTNGHAPV